MASHKRSLAATVSIAAAALTFTAGPVSAATYVRAAPYVQAPTLSISLSDPCKGTSQVIQGNGFAPGSAISLTLHPPVIPLGSAVVSTAGGFTKTIRIPHVTGVHRLVAAGPPTNGNPNTAEVTVNIRDCTGAASGPIPITGYSGNPSGGSGHGFPVGLAAGLGALACLTAGGGLAWWRRSRKHTI